jgi:hypothetical protein
MAKTLRQLDFEVIEEIDVAQKPMKKAIKAFGNRSGNIQGVLLGKNIKFEWNLKNIPNSQNRFGSGVWVVSDDGLNLRGTWSNIGASSNGAWDLKKIR